MNEIIHGSFIDGAGQGVKENFDLGSNDDLVELVKLIGQQKCRNDHGYRSFENAWIFKPGRQFPQGFHACVSKFEIPIQGFFFIL